MRDGTSNRAAERLTRLARSQYGVFTRQQAHTCGLTDDSLWRRTKSGLLVAESKNVFRFAVVPQSFKQMLLAQCLRAPGRIWASHRAAGALWQLDEILPEVVEVTSLISIAPSRSDVVVHRVADMPSRDTCVLAGIPVTTVHRTLVDLGAVAGADVVEAAMESALRRRLTTIEKLEARMAEIGGRGRRGTGVLRRVLARREPGAPPTDSGLETQFVQLLRRGRLPQPSRQQVVRDESGLVARVDFEYLGRDIVIEVDSRKHHLRMREWEKDLKRRNRITSQGKRVLHVTYRRMKTEPQGILDEIRAALRATRA
jgi:very-short-patch-repair endonuclease